MNQKIIDYLQQNKDKYDKEDLIKELEKFGFSKSDIEDGVKDVYGSTQNIKNSQDIQRSQKVVDYLQQNKTAYAQGDLIVELEKQGYSKAEIDSAAEVVYSQSNIQKTSKKWVSTAERLIGWITVVIAVPMNIVGVYKYFVETDGNIRLFEANHFNLLILLALAQALAMLCLILGMLMIVLSEKNTKGNSVSTIIMVTFIYLVIRPVYFIVIFSMGINEYIVPPALGVAFVVGIVLLIGGILGVWAIRNIIKNKQVWWETLSKSMKQIVIIISVISILVIAEVLIIAIVSPTVLSRKAYEFSVSGASSGEILKRQELRTCPNFNEAINFFGKVYVIDYYKSIPDGDAICNKVKQYEYGGGYGQVAITVYVNSNSFKIDGNYIDYDVTIDTLKKNKVGENISEYNFDDGRGYYHPHMLNEINSRCEVQSAYFPDNEQIVVDYKRSFDTKEECQNITSGKKIVEELREVAKKYKLDDDR